MIRTILSSHFCLFQNSLIDLLTSKSSCFILKKFKMLFSTHKRKKRFWTTNPFFSGLRMYFYWWWYLIWSDGCLLHLKHGSLGFNVYHWQVVIKLLCIKVYCYSLANAGSPSRYSESWFLLNKIFHNNITWITTLILIKSLSWLAMMHEINIDNVTCSYIN